jgi:hypothetical protein
MQALSMVLEGVCFFSLFWSLFFFSKERAFGSNKCSGRTMGSLPLALEQGHFEDLSIIHLSSIAVSHRENKDDLYSYLFAYLPSSFSCHPPPHDGCLRVL